MPYQLVIAVIGALPAFVAALSAAVIGWRNSRKADVIHQLVNSNLKAVQTDLALAQQRIEELSELVSKLTNQHP